MTVQQITPRTIRAQELYGDYWFNSEPVPVLALRGSVVLIQFWDHTCGGCLRALPYVREWHRRYGERGLTVIGVHTPRFSFGRNPELILKTLQRYDVRFPVVMDNDGLISSRYGSRGVPSLTLIDKDGFVRYATRGEGDYQDTEHEIQTLLLDAGLLGEFPMLMEPLRDTDRTGAVAYRATPELFGGYLQGSIGNIEGFSPESIVRYADPLIYLDGRFYVAGDWMNLRDNLRWTGGLGPEAQIIVQYEGLEANGVLRNSEGKSATVVVRQDGRYLTDENRGADVTVGQDGVSFLTIEEPRFYHIVKNREFGQHLLRLMIGAKGVEFYSVSFVSAVVTAPVSDS